MEVLPCSQKPLHEERRFHQVSTVIEHAKHWHRLSSASVHVVRPGTVVTLRVFKKSDNLAQPLNSLVPRDEAPIYAHNQGSDGESARAGGHDAVVARNVLASHARVRISSFPVIMETGLLQHGE